MDFPFADRADAARFHVVRLSGHNNVSEFSGEWDSTGDCRSSPDGVGACSSSFTEDRLRQDRADRTRTLFRCLDRTRGARGAGRSVDHADRRSFRRLAASTRPILAGSAAGIAAAFNTPLAGIVFAIEEMSRSYESRANGVVLTAVILSDLAALGLSRDHWRLSDIRRGFYDFSVTDSRGFRTPSQSLSFCVNVP